MDEGGRQIDPLGLGSLLSSGVIKARLAEILEGWTGRRRPAVLLVAAERAPYAAVYAEDELLRLHEGTPIVDAEPIGECASGSLLVFVVDEPDVAGYRIVDPRGGD